MLVLKVILNWLSGGLLDKVMGFVQHREDAKLAAMSATERLDFAERQHVREMAKEVRLATAGFWEMRLLTAIVLAVFVLHVVLIGLDTCFGLGWRVAKFPDPIDDYEWQIILSLFGLGVANRAITAAAAVLTVRRK